MSEAMDERTDGRWKRAARNLRARGCKGWVAAATIVVGCAASAAGCVKSTINNSESLRWWLFSNYGAPRLCPELLNRGVPLKVAMMGPASFGRFFAGDCRATVQDASRTVVMEVRGTGYAHVPVAGRAGFAAAMTFEFRPDVRLLDDHTYVWGRFVRNLTPADVRIVSIQNPVGALAQNTPFGDVTNGLARGLVESEVGRGFTVVRSDSGDVFGVGIYEPPAMPPRPFEATQERTLLESDTVGLPSGERVFLGPFSVPRRSKLTVRGNMQCAQARLGIVTRTVGDAWRRDYERGAALGPPPGPVETTSTIGAGPVELSAPLPEGTYFLVVENGAPSVAFLPGLPSAPPTFSYAVEVSKL